MLASSMASAQTPPDAGALRQQIERDQLLLPVPPAQPPQVVAPRAEKADSGASVPVRGFRYTGNSLIAEEALDQVVAPWVGRDVTVDGLRDAARAVAEAYREAGWVVQTFLPKQDVTEGVVTIQVVEARFGGARLEGDIPQRLKPAVWQRIVDAAQPVDDPLSARQLDRALLLIDDLPGVIASGSLVAGAQDGQTDLLLNLNDAPLIVGNLGVDNTGSRSTGRARLTGSFSIDSPMGFGDQLSVSLIHAEGDDYGRLGYSIPVGGDGWRIGASISNLDYQLVAPDFVSLDADGYSRAYGFDTRYPLVRGRQKNLYLSANIDHKLFENRASGSVVSDYTVDVAAAGLLGNLYDGLGGGGVNQGSLLVYKGYVDPDANLAARTDRSNGDFAKLRVNLSRQQVLTSTLSGYLAYAAQWSGDNLDSSEKFYLGGPNGVRAYPVNEGAGASGQLINLELRKRLSNGLSLSAFYDWGQVRQYANTIDTNGASLLGTESNLLTYKGYGVSVGWLAPFGAQFRATWAHRLGDNPHPAANGDDQDGSLVENRFWLSLAVPFEY